MEQHLPKIYVAFREAHPEVANALDKLGRATEQAGPLDARTQRLVKVALAVGSLSEGAVRSNARKALEAGDTATEIRHVALLAITTCGFPTAIRRARLDRRGPRARRGALMPTIQSSVLLRAAAGHRCGGPLRRRGRGSGWPRRPTGNRSDDAVVELVAKEVNLSRAASASAISTRLS